MRRALLVGYGSVGKRHLEELLKNYDTVDVVDLKFEERKNSPLPDNNRVLFFSNINLLDKNFNYDLAVVATWGPTHLSVVEKVLTFRPKFILLEKPVESSIAKVNEIERLIIDSNTNSTVNFSLRYSPLLIGLTSLLRENQLGQVCTITITAGAKCIATNGIHYLDLFMHIFREAPIAVNSQISCEKINPRQASLSFLGGVANFLFTRDRMLSLIFSNKSYSELVMEITLERGKITFSNSRLMAFQSSQPEIFLERPKTRSVVFDSILSDQALSDISNRDGISQMYSQIHSHPDSFSILDATESTRQILRACVATAMEKTLQIDEVIPNELINKDWLIS